MYYSILDTENMQLLRTGRNSKTVLECVEDFFPHFIENSSADNIDGEGYLKQIGLQEAQNIMFEYNFLIVSHKYKLPDVD